MQNSYQFRLTPELSSLWKFSSFQIDFEPTTQQLVRIQPNQKIWAESNLAVPKLVDETKQALAAFMRRDWSIIKQWQRTAQSQLRGTAFQVAVWKAMCQIPAGKVVTYQELATQIGRAGAARAVGAACGANPFPFLIPCHRVVAQQGIGGYGYGVELKQQLLQFESLSHA